MLQIAIIGIITAILAVVVSNWNGGKNPSNPSNPTKPNPSQPGSPGNPGNSPSPSSSDSLISNPPLLSKNAKGKYELVVAYKTGKIYNPRSEEWDPLVVRGYLTKASLFNKKKTGEYVEDLLVGPQIRVKQGETLSINLNNQLPPESDSTCPETIEDVNDPHCYNTTNIHTHGLWVSPQGNSDNVFLKFAPGEKFDYQYKIEKNHPAGTYWYHAHLHGSTAIQVSNGMAGALIVEGNRVPKVKNGKVTETGDIDILWKDKGKDSYPNENILLFQQIQYECTNPDPEIKFSAINNCDGKGVGQVEDYDELASPTSWGDNNYYTSINGKILGEIKAEQNQFNRWRMIHGGVRDTIGLIIKELPNSQKFTAEQTIEACSKYQGSFDADDPAQEEASKAEFAKLKTLPVHTIAQDGLTMTQVQNREVSVFQPGYRQDAMVTFPTTNKYCIFDTRLNIDDEINSTSVTGRITPQLAPTSKLNAQLIGWVNVSASKTKAQTAAQFLKDQAQKIGLSKEIQTQLSKLDLSAFTDHESLMTAEVDRVIENKPKQFNAFRLNLDFSVTPPLIKFGLRHDETDTDTVLSFEDRYDGPGSIDGQYVRQLKIGDTEEWVLTSDNIGVGHPFHIHVNPFQIVKILNRDGEDVSGAISDPIDEDDPGAADAFEDVQYRGLKGQYKDTIFVKGGYTVIARSKYKKFEGDFVQHCHILDHEDLGMMETVRICGDKFACNSPLPASHSSSHSMHH